MKHQLIVLVGGVERVCACGVRCNTRQEKDRLVKVSDFITKRHCIR